MYYGTINADGSINTAHAYSRNFTVTPGGTSGTFIITFRQYTKNAPTFTATAISGNTAAGLAVNVQWTMNEPEDGEPYEVTVITSQVAAQAGDEAFAFQAKTGNEFVFPKATHSILELTPSLIKFDSSVNYNVLSISHVHSDLGITVDFDQGTSLTAVGDNITLSIPASLQTEDKTWGLWGRTFGLDLPAQGEEWTDDGNGNYIYPISLSRYPLPAFIAQLVNIPEVKFPMLSPYFFVILATDGTTTLASDPLIRLTSVPPCGLSI